jgi:hypothetical protein
MSTLLDMSDVIESMAETITLIRRPAAILDEDGYAIQLPETTEQVRAVVEPAPSLANDEQRSMPGAHSTDRVNACVLGLDRPIECSSPENRGDRIIYNGKTYEAADSLDWKRLGNYSWARFEVVDTRVEGEP